MAGEGSERRWRVRDGREGREAWVHERSRMSLGGLPNGRDASVLAPLKAGDRDETEGCELSNEFEFERRPGWRQGWRLRGEAEVRENLAARMEGTGGFAPATTSRSRSAKGARERSTPCSGRGDCVWRRCEGGVRSRQYRPWVVSRALVGSCLSRCATSVTALDYSANVSVAAVAALCCAGRRRLQAVVRQPTS
jgi:hypothetical protein